MVEEKDTNSAQKGNMNLVIKILFLITTIVAIWTPFSGYSYIKGFLENFGFQNVNIDINVYHLVFSLFIGMTDGLLDMLESSAFSPIYHAGYIVILTAIGTGAVVSCVVFFKDRLKVPQWIADADTSSVKFAAILGIVTSTLMALILPMALVVIWFFSILLILSVWLMGVVGFIGGNHDAIDRFEKGFCFNSIEVCAELLVDNVFTPVEILYSDSSMSYVISAEGLIAVNPEGKAVYRLSMEGVKAKFAIKDEAPKGGVSLTGE